MYLFHCGLICVYFYDDVSGCFYPFVNKIELSWVEYISSTRFRRQYYLCCLCVFLGVYWIIFYYPCWIFVVICSLRPMYRIDWRQTKISHTRVYGISGCISVVFIACDFYAFCMLFLLCCLSSVIINNNKFRTCVYIQSMFYRTI